MNPRARAKWYWKGAFMNFSRSPDKSRDDHEKGELVALQKASTPLVEERAKGVEGLQEAAFICEAYAARLAEGNDQHAEYDAVCECFALIDRRIRELEKQS